MPFSLRFLRLCDQIYRPNSLLQEEHIDKNGFTEPPGIHLIPLPFADDIRAAPIEEAFRGTYLPFFLGQTELEHPIAASDDLKDAARSWIDKLSVKNGTYPPDSYPNPGNHPHFYLHISICSLRICLSV